MSFRSFSGWLRIGIIVGSAQFFLYSISWLTGDRDGIMLAVYPGAYVGTFLPMGSPNYAYHLVGVSVNWLLYTLFITLIIRERRRLAGQKIEGSRRNT